MKIMPFNDNNHDDHYRPTTRAATRPHLYDSFVPATRASSSRREHSVSSTMANSDGVSDRGNASGTRSKHGEHASSETAQESESNVREDVNRLVQSMAEYSTRVTNQELLLKNQHIDDTSLLQNVSPAIKQRISEAYLDAAEEQYRLGDLLQQKASAVINRSPDMAAKRSLARYENHIDHSASIQEQLSETSAAAPAAATPASPAATSPNLQDKPMEENNGSPWMPRALRELTNLELGVECDDLETFEWRDIKAYLRGSQWSPGLYYAESPSPDKVISCRTYWLLEKKYEPFAPSVPGMHGAKLTAFFRSAEQDEGAPCEEDYDDLPVFVSTEVDDEYTYMGHYTQSRFSDTLGFDTMEHIPCTVFEYWSDQLTDPERPEWVTQELIKHFWPKPCYEGPIPTDSAVATPATATITGEASSNHNTLERRVREGLAEYAQELKEWDRDARMRAGKLTPSILLDAFTKADTEMPPGLRLQWEYLKCLRWDSDFYKRMLQYKIGVNYQKEPSKKKKKKKKKKMAGPSLAEEVDAHCASVAVVLATQRSTATAVPESKQHTPLPNVEHGSKGPKHEQSPGYVAPHMRDIAR